MYHKKKKTQSDVKERLIKQSYTVRFTSAVTHKSACEHTYTYTHTHTHTHTCARARARAHNEREREREREREIAFPASEL